MKLEALGYRVLVQPDPLEETSAGGIVMVYSDERQARAATQRGTVVMVGPEAYADSKEPWVKPGDYINYARYAGKVVVDPETEEEYLIMNDEDILCRIGTKDE